MLPKFSDKGTRSSVLWAIFRQKDGENLTLHGKSGARTFLSGVAFTKTVITSAQNDGGAQRGLPGGCGACCDVAPKGRVTPDTSSRTRRQGSGSLARGLHPVIRSDAPTLSPRLGCDVGLHGPGGPGLRSVRHRSLSRVAPVRRVASSLSFPFLSHTGTPVRIVPLGGQKNRTLSTRSLRSGSIQLPAYQFPRSAGPLLTAIRRLIAGGPRSVAGTDMQEAES